MSYLVLARKYRPQTFDQVVKQDHVTRTLTNAIVSGRVAHAMLFAGPRGTGKTTIARILAKSLNCEKGPLPTPCNTCRSCTEITGGSSVDVFEIDGASNNGVDHIRELRENVKYMPAHSRYKIYIIDEVHMLSTPAFNALLKTLEEPPAHILFMFATTEPHKIPITILSRCQRHDLRRISIEDVSKHMESLCSQEQVTISKESLELVARESGGSMRDALSLLDQVMVCSEDAINHKQVLDILGVIDRKIIFDISDAMLRRDIPELFDIFDRTYEHGHNLKELYSQLIEHFRNLLVVKIGKKVSRLVDVPAHEINMMAEQVKDISEIWLTQMLDILFKEETSINYSSQPKIALEMAFVRMFQTKPAMPIEVLIEKLDNLQKGIYEDLKSFGGIPVPPVQKVSSVSVSEPEKEKTPQMSTTSDSGASSFNGGNSSETQQPPVHSPADTTEEEPEKSPENLLFDPNDTLDKTWEKFINILFSKKRGIIASILQKSKLEQLTDNTLELYSSGNGYDFKKIEENRSDIEAFCAEFFNKEIKLVIRQAEAPVNQNQEISFEQSKKEALNHPMVKAALEIFGGKVVNVKIL